MTLRTPTYAADMARDLVNDARIVDRALAGYVTVEGLTQALAAMQRIRSRGAGVASALNRLRREAEEQRAQENQRRRLGLPTPVTSAT